MRTIDSFLSGYLAWLLCAFEITPDHIARTHEQEIGGTAERAEGARGFHA